MQSGVTEPGCGRKIFPAAWGLRSPGDAEVEFGMALGGKHLGLRRAGARGGQRRSVCRVSAVWGLALPQGSAWIVSCTKSRRRNPGHLGGSLARVNEGDLGQVVELLLDVHLPGRDPSLYPPRKP